MTIAGSVRRLVAGLIASNRYTRVLFKRIALDEVLLPLILKDPLFAPRVLRLRIAHGARVPPPTPTTAPPPLSLWIRALLHPL
mgnify:CR=1 FL=1